ncbi:MAG: hypothetical protein AVDCRST_MAG25-1733, partial [uncultured Rubrobacteraceae bacterium]
ERRAGPPGRRPRHVQGGPGSNPRLPRRGEGSRHVIHRPRGSRAGPLDQAGRYRHAAGHAAQDRPGDRLGAAGGLAPLQGRRAHAVGQPALPAGHLQDGHRRLPAQVLIGGGAPRHPGLRGPRPRRRERGHLDAPRPARAPRRRARGRPLGEGDRGRRARRPRPHQPHDRQGAATRRGDRQAPPGQHLPEGGGPLQERGREEGPDGAVDRPPRDNLPRVRRRGRPLERLTGRTGRL